MKTLRDIATEWLKANGYDGLYNDNVGCECKVDDLMPCGDWMAQDCTAGHFVKCDPETCSDEDDCGWHIGQKQEKK